MHSRAAIGVGLLACALGAGAATPQFDALSQRLEAAQVGSVEGLIAQLPTQLFGAYALAFASRSLQGASFASPRAILYGTDARFIVTFNGEAGARGSGSVETMEFDASENRFVLREISFAANGDPAGRTLSEPNPARCLACHGTPARPIWDLPPAWPGMYGERYGAGLAAAEKRGIEAFLARQGTHPRYRYLTGADRFRARATYVADGRAVYGGTVVESPNERLSHLLGTLNARSVLSELIAHPAFGAHRYALLGAASGGCGPMEGYFPAERAAEVRRAFQEFRQREREVAAREAGAKAQRRPNGARATAGAGATAGLEALRFVVQEGLGISAGHWGLALEQGAAASSDEGARMLEQGLLEAIAAREPELRERVAYRLYTPTDGYCDFLTRASRRALSDWYEEHPPIAPAVRSGGAAAPRATPRLLDTCAGCHTGEVAPAIPFAAPDALAARLLEGDYPRGRLLEEILYRLGPRAGAEQMPRGLTPSDPERRELEDYFLALTPGTIEGR